VVALGWGIARGPHDLLAAESDRLSVVHLALFALIAAFWVVVAWGEETRTLRARSLATAGRYPDPAAFGSSPAAPTAPGTKQAIGRLAVAVIGVAAVGVLMVVLFPGLRHGALGAVDPLYARIRLQNILEFQPLVSIDLLTSDGLGEALGRVIRVLGIALFAVPFLCILLRRSTGPARRFWATVALALLAFLPLAFYQVRWGGYAEAFLVWPYAAAVLAAIERLPRALRRARIVVRPLVILAALLWPLLLPAALPQQKIETARQACPLDRLAAVLDRAAPEPRTLLAYADYGSELLYRTPHRVLSIPN